MKQILNLPLGTRLVYNSDSKTLTLASLCGMTCGHNGKEDAYSCSGLAVIGMNHQRLEGKKLQYEILRNDGAEFCLPLRMPRKSSNGKAAGALKRNTA